MVTSREKRRSYSCSFVNWFSLRKAVKICRATHDTAFPILKRLFLRLEILCCCNFIQLNSSCNTFIFSLTVARSAPTGPWPSRESLATWPNITRPRRSTRAPTRAVRFACPLPGAWRDTWPRAASSWTPSSRGQSKRRTFPGVLAKTLLHFFGDEIKSGMEPQNRSSETSFNIFESH